jgi:hypothetical protein
MTRSVFRDPGVRSCLVALLLGGCGGGTSAPPGPDGGAGSGGASSGTGGGGGLGAAGGRAGAGGGGALAGGGGTAPAGAGGGALAGAGGGAFAGAGGGAFAGAGGAAGGAGAAGSSGSAQLTGLILSPTTVSVPLVKGTTPGTLAGTSPFTVQGSFADGSSRDVTSTVSWSEQPQTGVTFVGATATLSAPGTFTIIASSGSVTSNAATLTATFAGGFVCADFTVSGICVSYDPGTEAILDGTASGTTTIAYPLQNSLFPSNLGPLQVQLTSSGSYARINFETPTSGNLKLSFYGSCESGPGSGCYLTIPAALTQLLVPSSESEDVQITGRVSSGAAPKESAPLTANWTDAPLTGALYYWATIPTPPTSSSDLPTPPSYVLLDPTAGSGTQVDRYDFSKGNPTPEVVWTDDGGPGSTPAFDGAPGAWDSGIGGGHCLGCHGVTGDGKYMALTIGGSSSYSGANWALLDIANQALELINPPPGVDTSIDSNATPTNDPANYWKSYRNEGFATETAWGPNDDALVDMYRSTLYFSTVAIGEGSATVTRQGPAFPSYVADPYASDPCWSQDGSLFAFTSFSQLATANATGNPGGLNGDLKTGGQIAIATAEAERVHDDATLLVGRGNGVTNYYPTISSDSQLLIFDQSTCGAATEPLGGGYGTGTCDGYDDSSAKLWLVSTAGGAAVRLDNANGGANTANDDSWPRFGPDKSTFRGKTLYWVAFSSRRAYGVQVNATSTISATQPQLWFAGVSLGASDPSFAPVWLPGQNPSQSNPSDNHTPQWVKVAAMIN